ncbi:hypothetical protein RvY_16221 [Ramazzottius varieornatus]|uniref:Uncharacterized protein n=1 Tax=Ramazzottius varieornatus TaxID=947166 RepID=A0A1D1VXP2_RAMVA|nr:hypothetical protein RvY_16221 [Ramazzottius varieornatus]
MMMQPRNPQMVNCRCCGRQYGHWSIGIHEPQCQKKNQQEQANNRLAVRRSQNLSRVSVTPLGHGSDESAFDNQVVPTHLNRSNNEIQRHNDMPFRPNNQQMQRRSPRDVQGRPPFDSNPQPNDDILGHVRISYINGTEFGSDTYAIPRPPRPPPRAHGQPGRGQSHDMSTLLENMPRTVIRSTVLRLSHVYSVMLGKQHGNEFLFYGTRLS